jgi:hypothetical protein
MSDGFQTSGGWIEVIAGVMFSGKSEELMRRVRRAVIARKRVQVFKSHLDARYAGVHAVSSHDRRTVDAIPVDSPSRCCCASTRPRRWWRATRRSSSTTGSCASRRCSRSAAGA